LPEGRKGRRGRGHRRTGEEEGTLVASGMKNGVTGVGKVEGRGVIIKTKALGSMHNERGRY